jgi:hypothetical protein
MDAAEENLNVKKKLPPSGVEIDPLKEAQW